MTNNPKTGDLTKDLSAPQLRDFIERYATRAAGADCVFVRVSLQNYIEKHADDHIGTICDMCDG